MSYILGISAFYHDSAATLIKNGEILSAGRFEFQSVKNQERCIYIDALGQSYDYTSRYCRSASWSRSKC